MAASSKYTWIAVADAVSLCCAVSLIALILMSSTNETAAGGRRSSLVERPCDEIYVVGEGETLHTISDRCGDPYIVERNPHIHDPDDVFPGLVIRILPLTSTPYT